MLLGLAILAEVIGTTALKASDGFTRLAPAALVIAGYGLAFYLLALTLRAIPVGIAYAAWSGAGTVLIALVGWWMFGQRLDGWAVGGIALIVAGVVLLNLRSGPVGH